MQMEQVKSPKNWSKKNPTPSHYRDERDTSDQDSTEWPESFAFALYLCALREAKQEAKQEGRKLTRVIRTPYRQKQVMTCLESAAESGNERAFLTALKDADWENRSVSEFIKVIRLALKAGAHLAAREISIEGVRHFPDNPEIQKYHQGLARPTVIARNLPPNPTLHANREWLRTNSGVYRGRWVALRNGQLLATAISLKELTEQMSERENILFTKVR